jgi:hypothetical protein
MGLLKNNTEYIRLALDGTYFIYKTKKDRLREKRATPREKVLNKYQEIIAELYADEEAIYYLGNINHIQEWEKEFYAYFQKDTSAKFPLMKAYIPDVHKSIVEFVAMGKIQVKGTTLKEIYEEIKNQKVFGETEDDL